MLPGNIRHLCEQLLAAPVRDAQKQVSLVEPPLEKRIKLFTLALKLVQEHVNHPWYGLYVCTVLGYRRLVVRDDECSTVDSLIVELLQAQPEIIPNNCYTDRLPPKAFKLRDKVRLLRRNFLQEPLDIRYLERMAAD